MDPNYEKHELCKKWKPEDFNSEIFDTAAVNRQLMNYIH